MSESTFMVGKVCLHKSNESDVFLFKYIHIREFVFRMRWKKIPFHTFVEVEEAFIHVSMSEFRETEGGSSLYV